MSGVCFFFLMIWRPPRSTPLSLHDALPISRHTFSGGWCRSTSNARDSVCDRGVVSVGVIRPLSPGVVRGRSEEHTSELQSRQYLVCRLLLEKKNGVRHSLSQYVRHRSDVQS